MRSLSTKEDGRLGFSGIFRATATLIRLSDGVGIEDINKEKKARLVKLKGTIELTRLLLNLVKEKKARNLAVFIIIMRT